MPIIYTDHAFKPALEQELRELWRRIDGLLAERPKVTAADTPVTGGAAGGAAAGDVTASFTYVIDGGGSALTPGIKGDLRAPFACTILEATLLAEQAGSAVLDIWKCTYLEFDDVLHPVVGDTIVAATPPTIISNVKAVDSVLAGWKKAIKIGDVLRFNVNSAAFIQRLMIALKVVKT